MAMVDITQLDNSTKDDFADDVTIPSMETDGISDQKENEWINTNWSQQWGYFNQVADLQSALIMKSVWNTGKGWTADFATESNLNNISGWGKDTFDDIIFNLDLVSNIGGDSYAEIVRNPDSGTLINLKCLDPGVMKTIINGKGIIIRYEQVGKVGFIKRKLGISPKTIHTFTPQQILHISKNRFADQIHGISVIDALVPTILADNESFEDVKQLMHHQAIPFIIWKLKTDDTTKISKVMSKIKDARKNRGDLFIPDDEDILDFETVQVNLNQVVLDWRTDIRNGFYRKLGLPLILFGASGSTESGGKMEVFAHETVFAREQRFLEKQIWNQLGIKIKLNPPQTLLDNLQKDQGKDAQQGLEAQPQDLTAGAGE